MGNWEDEEVIGQKEAGRTGLGEVGLIKYIVFGPEL